jgi:cyclin-dependent kinase 8/11
MPLRLRPGGPFFPSSSASASPSTHHRYADSSDRGGPGYQPKTRVTERYRIVGFISSGTYGRVYKAIARTTTTSNGSSKDASSKDPSAKPITQVAIKKFKPDKEGEQVSYTGISQSAIREMSLCAELRHANVIRLVETLLEDKCIFMVLEYAEHDLLQIIHHHTTQPPGPRRPIPPTVVKSFLFQLLNGCHYLHTSWVLHRDLKPANIMVTDRGRVMIGDLGLARRFDKPLASLFGGDKVVVTIWYRAPELILGSYHYTPAIDLWAVGCIFAELLSLRPIFKGEEAKMDSKKTVPFQRNQMQKIVEILGMPNKDRWPLLSSMPDYPQLSSVRPPSSSHDHHHHHHSSSRAYPTTSSLEKWYFNTINHGSASTASTPATTAGSQSPLASLGVEGFRLLSGLLEYDPTKRLTAAQALQHPFFSTGDRVNANAFEGLKVEYPHRRVSQDDNDIRTSTSLPGTKRSAALGDDSLLRPTKRVKD